MVAAMNPSRQGWCAAAAAPWDEGNPSREEMGQGVLGSPYLPSSGTAHLGSSLVRRYFFVCSFFFDRSSLFFWRIYTNI
jgi:hypothetical protein